MIEAYLPHTPREAGAGDPWRVPRKRNLTSCRSYGSLVKVTRQKGMAMTVTKSKPKKSTLVPVPVEEAKAGEHISLHGTIESATRMTGRSLWSKWVKKGKGKTLKFKHARKQPEGYELHKSGPEGILFKTNTGEYFYPLGSTVWMVR